MEKLLLKRQFSWPQSIYYAAAGISRIIPSKDCLSITSDVTIFLLTIGASSEGTEFLPRNVPYKGVDGNKWARIARCGNELFCAPKNTNSMPVIDSEKEETRVI